MLPPLWRRVRHLLRPWAWTRANSLAAVPDFLKISVLEAIRMADTYIWFHLRNPTEVVQAHSLLHLICTRSPRRWRVHVEEVEVGFLCASTNPAASR